MKLLTDEVFAQVRGALEQADIYLEEGSQSHSINRLAIAALDAAQSVPEVNAMLVEALQAQPEPSEMTEERETYIAGLESRTHSMRKKIEALDYELRVKTAKLSELESQEPCAIFLGWNDDGSANLDAACEGPETLGGENIPLYLTAPIPANLVLVPLRLTRAMEEVFQQEDWQWADVLAAAEVVTEDQYLAALESDTQQAQPEPVNAMLVEALQAAENLEHEALVALSEATYELKVGNTYTTATDTYKANNDLIHRLDKILNSQYRDRKRAALTAAQQAQPEQHLFEFWWAEYMPDATQEQAFKAWAAAPSSKGVGIEQAQPERAPLSLEKIIEIVKAIDEKPGMSDIDVIVGMTRAIEARHGIKQGGQ